MNKDQMEHVLYTCLMHPEIQQNKPGACPKCGMTLVPLDHAQHVMKPVSEMPAGRSLGEGWSSSPLDTLGAILSESNGSKDDTYIVTVSPTARRAVRIARRVRYRNVLPSAASGSVAAPDPLFAALLERMDRSVQSGQIVWGEDGSSERGRNMVEWEAMLLPFLLIAGAHGVLTGFMKRSLLL